MTDVLADRKFDLVYDWCVRQLHCYAGRAVMCACSIGGAEYWELATRTLKPGGHFITIVGDGGKPGLSMLVRTSVKQAWRIFLSFLGSNPPCAYCQPHQLADPHRPPDTRFTCFGDGQSLRKLSGMLEDHHIKSVIDTTYPLTAEGVQDAFALLKSHRARGKIVLCVSGCHNHS